MPGTPTDIDVNVASMTPEELRAAWPFGALVESSIDLIASVPVPVSRATALAGEVTIAYAPVEWPRAATVLAAAFAAAGERYPKEQGGSPPKPDFADYLMASLSSTIQQITALADIGPGIDSMTTASIPKRQTFAGRD